MEQANDQQIVVRQTLVLKIVESWIVQAKELPRKISR
jgi:hypothetical protein